jgi:hypothetical protein
VKTLFVPGATERTLLIGIKISTRLTGLLIGLILLRGTVQVKTVVVKMASSKAAAFGGRLVGLEGVEPPTNGLGNRCSIHLSYRPVCHILAEAVLVPDSDVSVPYMETPFGKLLTRHSPKYYL